MARLDRYRIGISRELSEIRTQPWLRLSKTACSASSSNDISHVNIRGKCSVYYTNLGSKVESSELSFAIV